MGRTTTTLLIAIGVIASPYANQFPSKLPKFIPPAAATVVSVHGFAGGLPTQHPSSDLTPAMGAYYRLQTSGPTAAVGDHYARQLIPLGWQSVSKQEHADLSLFRFSAGSGTNRFIGTLTTVAFPKTQNVVVAIDVIRPRAAFRGRTGGGAGRSADVMIRMPDLTSSEVSFPGAVWLPAFAASHVEETIHGGTFDSSHAEARLESTVSPAEIMKIIEPQITDRGWIVDIRAGDAIQTVTKFSPAGGGDSTALLTLTALPGTREVSVILNVVRNRR